MGTVVLHHGSGASDFVLDGPPISRNTKEGVFRNIVDILTARRLEASLKLLEGAPFEVYPAINHFGDEFHVLYAEVPLFEYEVIRNKQQSLKQAACNLAEVIMEVADDLYVRFVAVGLQKLNCSEWVVFLCHASDDKEMVAQPIYQALTEAGFRCWYDEIEIGWGESLVASINAGLAGSRYVIVVVSPSMAKKKWAKKELQSALHIETEAGKTIVLPLLTEGAEELLQQFPFLAEKKYLLWEGNPASVISELRGLWQGQKNSRS
ncbi:MAG: toll/interleukin-1 receptor domain-containing protein [Candidatus Hydrogenedentes bacterium]|nr:toll/interleukin-1 receptor domain-containing protein [Candidatus Hydrogenedentota bacterium]